MRSRLFTLALAALAISGCTRGVGTLVEAPTAPTPRVMRLTITPVGGLRIIIGTNMPVTTSGGLPSGGVALGAFAEYENGQTSYVDATWTSSDTAVVAVANGVLETRKRGSAILTATFDGRTDRADVIVDGGFFGRWSGTYVVQQCSANSGSMDDVLCRQPSAGRSGIAPIGATVPFTIEIPETTSEDITARVNLGVAQGSLTGKNRGGGFFHVLGDLPIQGGTVSVVDWNMRGLNDAMEGLAHYHVRLNGVQGAGSVVLRLSNVVRQ